MLIFFPSWLGHMNLLKLDTIILVSSSAACCMEIRSFIVWLGIGFVEQHYTISSCQCVFRCNICRSLNENFVVIEIDFVYVLHKFWERGLKLICMFVSSCVHNRI